jgi:hypothetical protein
MPVKAAGGRPVRHEEEVAVARRRGDENHVRSMPAIM